MLTIVDFQVDESDDIILDGDIFYEEDVTLNVVKTAERRISARYDDFILNNVGAGIERFLSQRINDFLELTVSDEIKNVLSAYNLLTPLEYEVLIPEHNSSKLPIFIRFISPLLGSDYNFRVIINQENQRSYN